MNPKEFSTEEREALQYWRFHHPHSRGQRKMEALYLKSQGVVSAEVCRLCAISRSTYARYVREYRGGALGSSRRFLALTGTVS